MYPYLRLLKVLLASRFGERLRMDSVTELKMRVWPSDIDIYPEMNNGRHLTLMDLGRIDLAGRTGLMRIAHRKQNRKTCSSALIRAGLKKTDGLVPVKDVLEAMNEKTWIPKLPDWVCAWKEAEELCPHL